MEEVASQEQIITALVYGLIFVVLLTTGLMVFFHYSRRKITEKEIEKIAIMLEQKQKVLQASIATQEEERKRIAKDLHDAISAKLNVVSLTTHVLLDDDSINKDQRESLEHILNVTSGTLESSRKIAHDLMPPILEKFGMKVALEELIEDFIKSKQLEIEHTIEEIEYLTKTEQLHVFRIVQELINNSVRHGKASLIKMSVYNTDTGFKLHFIDDGKGFDLNVKKSGIGLQNIQSRVDILSGTFDIQTAPNKGSIFTINCINHG